MANADLRAIERLARGQDQVVSRRQLLELGASHDWIRRQIRNQRWQRVFPGVYAIHTGRPTWRTRARAALIYAGPGAALSHSSAAYHHLLRDRPGSVIVVSVPANRRVRPQPGLVVRIRNRMPPSGGRLRAIFEVETILDMANLRTTSEDDVVALVCALAKRNFSMTELEAAVRARSRLRHRRLLLDLGHLVEHGIESPLEFRYHGIERRHGLPVSVLQERQLVHHLWLRADCRYHGFRVRVELDGQLAHPGGRTDADTMRDNIVLIASDEITLRFRWRHVVAAPCEVAEQVTLALWSRGWTGRPTPCGPRCVLHRLTRAT
ncbi:MAG: type IV toxin-antitoxin system AbiEi family antitoxin domain-containing protein [Georgenia sp.]